MPPYLRAPLLIAAASIGVGCSAPVSDDVTDASSALTDGVVLVERTVSSDGAAQTYVSAKFMRLATPADPEIAERVVGSTLSLPQVGTCRRAAAETVDDRSRALASIGAIELIDVGDISLRTGDAVTTLAARAFPDVGDIVSGMFYTSRDAASDLPSGATYTLEGTGSAHVERFSIEADAPATPADVRLGEAVLPTAGEGSVIEEGAMRVRWRVGNDGGKPPMPPGEPAASKGPADLVLVDVTAENGASVRCTFEDRGEGTVPSWVWSERSLGPLPAAATVAVHRVRERSFLIQGLDTGAVRFDLSVVGRVMVTRAPQVP